MYNLEYLKSIISYVIDDLKNIENTFNITLDAIDDIRALKAEYDFKNHDIDDIEIKCTLEDICTHINYDRICKALNINGLSVYDNNKLPCLIYTDISGNTYDYCFVDINSTVNLTDLCYQAKNNILFNLSSVLNDSTYNTLEYDIKNENVPEMFFYSVLCNDFTDSAVKEYIYNITHWLNRIQKYIVYSVDQIKPNTLYINFKEAILWILNLIWF